MLVKIINLVRLLLHIQYGSRKRGAGREIINKLLEFVKEERLETKRLLTLSPLTPMATHFHINNGAKLISINSETQNFEYRW